MCPRLGIIGVFYAATMVTMIPSVSTCF
jgi:hypothetical protein